LSVKLHQSNQTKIRSDFTLLLQPDQHGTVVEIYLFKIHHKYF